MEMVKTPKTSRAPVEPTDREPASRLARNRLGLATTVAMMGAVLSIDCGRPDEPASRTETSSATSALTITRINDANIPGYCLDSNSCGLMSPAQRLPDAAQPSIDIAPLAANLVALPTIWPTSPTTVRVTRGEA